MSGELAGSMALVTGAAQGIGRATATALAAEGAGLILNDRMPSAPLDELAAELDAQVAVADMGDPAAVAETFAVLERVDVLVVNHAVLTRLPFVDHAPADWWHDVQVDLSGAWHAISAVLPGMLERGYGRIVLMSSCWGITGFPETTAYSAAKAGLISLARSLALELAPRGVAVTAVAPGTVDTPQLEVDARAMSASLGEVRSDFAALTPVGRIAKPEEIARTVAFLASPRAGAMAGQVLQPNGGIVTGRG